MPWGKWEDLGGPPPSGICLYGLGATYTSRDNGVWLFAVGSDSALYRRIFRPDTGWGNWDQIGGLWTSAPAVASRSSFSPDIFIADNNGGITHFEPSGVDSAFEQAQGTPAVVSWGGNRLDVFSFITIASPHGLYHGWSDGDGWGAELISQAEWLLASPAAASWGPNRIDLFAIWGGSMEHIWWDGSGWHTGESLGGSCIRAAAAVAPAVNLIHCFTIGSDSAVYQMDFSGGRWSAWQRLDGLTCISAPAAVAAGAHIELFVIGADSHVYHRRWSSLVAKG
jgi:serine protease AprX